MAEYVNHGLRYMLRDYLPNKDDRKLSINNIELLYEMWINPSSSKEEKDFAEKKLIASFLSIYNTQNYVQKNKTYTTVVTSEDLDTIIAATVYKCLTKYKSDGGTDKDNFLRYCIGAIRRELYKEHKISLPFHMPHTTKSSKKKVLDGSKRRAVKTDANGLPVYDENGEIVYLQKRKIISKRDGTKCNKLLNGDLIEISKAAKMDDSLFEMVDVYDNTNYFGLRVVSMMTPSEGDDETTMAVANAMEGSISQGCMGNEIGDYKSLHSKYWETEMMNEDFKNKILEIPYGEILIKRYGLDRGYKRTAKELADELGMTPKTINYWCDKVMAEFRRRHKNYFTEYFAA